MRRILKGDNLPILRGLQDGIADLVYLDPPFNTGKTQARLRTRTKLDPDGKRIGFTGARYTDEVVGCAGFADTFDDYLGFLGPRLEELHRILTPTGSLFVHLDANEVHYVKVFLDGLFGRDCFQNEIVWAYDYGARSKKRWSAKHDSILWYTRDPKRYHFDFEAMDRIPYMAPKLVSDEKAARGKTPTDVWWHTIVAPQGKERTGYPTQKPMGVLERIVKVHSREGDLVLDPFAGSGTTGEAAAKHGRHFLLIDSAAEAVEVMRDRLEPYAPTVLDGGALTPPAR